MPSASLTRWWKERARQLDEIEAAHAAIGGRGRGRRVATQQVNYAYLLLLSAQFQGFCRDLHTECVDHIVAIVEPESIRAVVLAALTRGRDLDKGNARPDSLKTDFGRLRIDFWPSLTAYHRANEARRVKLEDLNNWRNAVAHQSFDKLPLGGRSSLPLHRVRGWRSALDGLAAGMDCVMDRHLTNLTGKAPW